MAYTQALEIKPNFAILYLLRADVRAKQGNLDGAFEDVNRAGQIGLGEELQALVDEASQTRETLNCEILLSLT